MIVVNGTELEYFDAETISYENVVRLSGGNPDHVHSVTYSVARKEHGILSPGDSVPVVNGMRFNAYVTSKA